MTSLNHSMTLSEHATTRSPMKNKVLLIVGLFILASITLMSMGYLQSEVLNGVRAFVRGEGLWAKAQKDAVFYIERYARSHHISDYQNFKDSLRINLGDKEGRLGLLETPPNRERSSVGFLEGGNHPDDINSMMDFFVNFKNFYYLKRATAIWERADKEVIQLMVLAEKMHHCVLAEDEPCILHHLAELEALNFELNIIATDFSSVLSEGARWIKSTLLIISLILISLLALAIFFITRHIILALDKTEKELMISETRFLSLYKANVIGIMDWHIDGRILSANDAYLNILGYSRKEFNEGKINWQAITPKEYKNKDKQAIDELLRSGVCSPFEKEVFNKQGKRIPVYLGAALLNGEHDKGICFVVDQSLQKSNETQLRLSATVFDASSDGIIITDQFKHIVAVNSVYCEKTGLSQSQLIGSTPPILVSSLMPEGFYQEVSKSLHETDHWQGDIFDTSANGDAVPVHMSINTVKDKHGHITHFVANITDISERKAAEEQLKKLAHYDYLTGLANRSLYHDRLGQSIIRARRHNTLCALLFFDLDKFKPINDLYGHEAGDHILQTVAARLKKLVRSNDTVARLGGDEFVIIMEDLYETQHAGEFAKKVISTLSQPCSVKDQILEIGCSVGISVYPQDGQDAISLTRNADIAMYAAKASGHNHYYFYSPSLKS